MSSFVYSPELIESLLQDRNYCDFLPEEVIEKIQKISSLVGAPNYVHTPTFTRPTTYRLPDTDIDLPNDNPIGGGYKRVITTKNQQQPHVYKPKQQQQQQQQQQSNHKYNNNNPRSNNNNNNNNNSSATSNEDWENVRNFKTTQLAKREGVDKNIDQIRIQLNKFSEKNATTLTAEIKTQLETILQDLTNEDACKISHFIFNVASSNKMYSHLYATLYQDLMTSFPLIKDTFETEFNNFLNIFENIVYVNPSKDYDGYCEMIKQNEKRIALDTFFINLMKRNVLHFDQIFNIIDTLQSSLLAKIKDVSQKEVIEEIANNIYIYCTEPLLYSHTSRWEIVKQRIVDITQLNKSEYKGITSRAAFKHLDILDFIKKNS